jgi:hypothetical protein
VGRQCEANQEQTKCKSASQHQPPLAFEIAQISQKQSPEKCAGPGDTHHPRQPAWSKVKDVTCKNRNEREIGSAKKTCYSREGQQRKNPGPVSDISEAGQQVLPESASILDGMCSGCFGRLVETYLAQCYHHSHKRKPVNKETAGKSEKLEAQTSQQWSRNARKLKLG